VDYFPNVCCNCSNYIGNMYILYTLKLLVAERIRTNHTENGSNTNLLQNGFNQAITVSDLSEAWTLHRLPEEQVYVSYGYIICEHQLVS